MYGTLTHKNLVPRALRYKPCGVITGLTGAGKTTLSNKLCGTRHKSDAAVGSVTQELYRNDVNCGDNAFSLIDTPGTDSSTETYKHACLLREGLTATDINTIFVLIKYNNRFEKMVDNYFQLVQPVYNYTRKTAVLISHMDVSKNPESDFKIIRQLFNEECPDVFNIHFFFDKSRESKITRFMYSCLSKMQAEILHISDEEFFMKFNVCEMRSQLKRAFKEYEESIKVIDQEFSDSIKTTMATVKYSVEDKDEILHMSIVEFKHETDSLYQNFVKTHGATMHQLDYYVFSIKMQKENVRICDEFVKKVAALMSYNLFDNKDIRNLIKQCPHCLLIWYKTEGCDGETTCGNRVSTYYDVMPEATAFVKFVITRVNGKRMFQRREDTGNTSLVSVLPQASAVGTGVGCGRPIVWSKLPKLDDKLIMELFEVETISEAVELIKGPNFQEVRATYESTIDKEFKS